ncbi:hypothetical protein [Rhizobium sullae]|uniref:Uncharacterized protein n=1 Tax=Rhizobium sullae TaxID=50338 RepID=A0A4V2V9A3_RHISU|nr:hypothetical protein [Rhizobium sullae]TCU16385.1 hypothetical protein EV132_105137 [Rhizobium sullae]
MGFEKIECFGFCLAALFLHSRPDAAEIKGAATPFEIVERAGRTRCDGENCADLGRIDRNARRACVHHGFDQLSDGFTQGTRRTSGKVSAGLALEIDPAFIILDEEDVIEALASLEP